MKRLSLLLASMVWVGCANNNPKEQVWIVTATAPTDAPVLIEEVTHNFADGRLPDAIDTSEWTVTEQTLTSDGIFTVQIVEIDGDEEHGAVMIVDDLVYPGIESDDGSWTFSWDNFDNITERQVHESGYLFEFVSQGTIATSITWSVDKKTKVASGSISTSIDNALTWNESDLFDIAEVGIYPQIPAWSFLVDTAGYPIQNGPASNECTADPCTIRYSATQTVALSFTAVETEYSDEDVFGAVDDAGQEFGS